MRAAAAAAAAGPHADGRSPVYRRGGIVVTGCQTSIEVYVRWMSCATRDAW